MKKIRTCLFAIAGIVLSSVLVLGCPSQDTKETAETQTTASDVTFAFNWVDLDGFDEVYDFIEKIKRSIVTSETPEVTE